MNQIYDAVTQRARLGPTPSWCSPTTSGAASSTTWRRGTPTTSPQRPPAGLPGPDRRDLPVRPAGPRRPPDVYDHTSILKLIEWRWGLKPLTPRDHYARNLAPALDFAAWTPPCRPTRAALHADACGRRAAAWRTGVRRMGRPRDARPPAGMGRCPDDGRRWAASRGRFVGLVALAPRWLTSAADADAPRSSPSRGAARRSTRAAAPDVRASGQARLRDQLREQGLRRDLGLRGRRRRTSRRHLRQQGRPAELLLRHRPQLPAQLHRADLRAGAQPADPGRLPGRISKFVSTGPRPAPDRPSGTGCVYPKAVASAAAAD